MGVTLEIWNALHYANNAQLEWLEAGMRRILNTINKVVKPDKYVSCIVQVNFMALL